LAETEARQARPIKSKACIFTDPLFPANKSNNNVNFILFDATLVETLTKTIKSLDKNLNKEPIFSKLLCQLMLLHKLLRGQNFPPPS
jgi:hypothetical protein